MSRRHANRRPARFNVALSVLGIAGLLSPSSIAAGSEELVDTQASTTSGIQQQAARHWAFQPVTRPDPPSVHNSAWVRSPVDSFILARLEEQGLEVSPQADRRTLIRRATYDLLGLPPSPEEVDAFLRDDSAEAYPHLIERLLGSYHYGERWGRYWLDIARYADTKGYVFTAERLFPYSYTFRDYVIRSFNADLPFDRFLIEQIAADLLPLGDDKRSLAALGFLTLGRRFLNNAHDIIDDRIDVVSRGTMGLTISCARCHDHKFDPVSIRDYYSLYGVFASSTEPDEQPLLGTASLPAEYPEFLEEKKRREQVLETFEVEKRLQTRRRIRRQIGDYLRAAHDAAQIKDGEQQEALIRERNLDVTLARRWMDYLKGAESSAVFGPWLVLAELGEFATEAPQRIAAMGGPDSSIDPMLQRVLTGEPVLTLTELAARYTQLFTRLDEAWEETLQSVKPVPDRFEDPEREALRQILYGEDSPLSLNDDQLARLFDIPTREKIRALQRDIDKVEATHPGAPPRAMALKDKAKPHDPHVFLRGNPSRVGPEVPRRFLEFFPDVSAGAFTNGSGRLELATAIASTNNPLTARVLVNRAWMFHFGEPLVPTPSDFGMRAEPPSHHALLDYLASRFMDQEWSIKQLHRLIMLSSVYQQSSQFDPASARIDPENQLLWRMNRRRLDFEAMRDTLLATSGQLDRTLYGRSVDITTEPFPSRRTVYAFIERQNLPGLFRSFDFATPDTTSPRRFDTTVPQQALFLMNSPFAIQQARHFTARPEVQAAATDADRLRAIWRLAYQRDMAEEELAWALDFVSADSDPTTRSDGAPSEPVPSLSRWEELAQVLLFSNEMFFVD